LFNPHIMQNTRANKDNEVRRRARQSGFGNNLPRVRLADLSNGQYRMRLWPEDGKKNPHGFLDFRQHDVPQEFLIDGVDPKIIKMQCPRSSNWDPMPQSYDEDGNPQYQCRCLPCELVDQVFSPLDPDDEDSISVYESLEGLGGLQEIIAKMDWKQSFFSTIAIPVTLQMRVLSRIKEQAKNGKEYENVTYAPGGPQDLMGALLQFRQPDQSTKIDEQTGAEVRLRNGFPEVFFDWLAQIPDASDPITGRWFTLTKSGDGKGQGGYQIQPDMNPTTFDVNTHVDYKKIYGFMDWGTGGKKTPTSRLTFDQQLSYIDNSAWALALKQAGVPITDEEVEAFMDGTWAMLQFNPAPSNHLLGTPGYTQDQLQVQQAFANPYGVSPATVPSPVAPAAFGGMPASQPTIPVSPSNPLPGGNAVFGGYRSNLEAQQAALQAGINSAPPGTFLHQMGQQPMQAPTQGFGGFGQ
jgi:hypothetical protein